MLPMFCEHPATVALDTDAEFSTLSLKWLLDAGLPAQESFCGGPLSLPGILMTCVMPVSLKIVSSLPYNIVLGRDWLLFCC
ncbi:unnamed protein product [Mycena citricolor]|uniref:Uncharacterized protein n=1 Tax=Mycena citricolor TaxID=2018698 RepID=A0AAD2Q2K5_9AGAR|nr:unnamed protein product [Mycena citricolor]